VQRTGWPQQQTLKTFWQCRNPFPKYLYASFGYQAGFREAQERIASQDLRKRASPALLDLGFIHRDYPKPFLEMNSDQQLLDKLIDLAEQQARLILLELKLPSLTAAWVLMTKAGKFEILATPWRDELEKQMYADMLRAVMRQKRVVAYSFVSEVWSRQLESGEWDQENNQPFDGIMASQDPAREEAVIAYAGTKNMARWKQWRIVREATTERIIDLKEQSMPGSECESWIAEMLK
jgi:hypothetical protein